MQDVIIKLAPNTIVQGPMLPEPVKIATIQTLGETIKLIGQGLQTGQCYDLSLTPEQLDVLEIVTEASYVMAIRSSFV